MSAPCRIALVGCGDIAEHGHLPALLAHPGFRLVATCDIRLERAQLLAQRVGGIPALTDYRQLVADPAVDAVVLALHPEHSVDAAIAFLRAGKHVLDEKPLACTVADGQRVAAAVNSAAAAYQIGFVFRYSPFVAAVARFADQIGRPLICDAAVYDEVWNDDEAHSARIQGILSASSAITHEGSHVIDFAQSWLRSPLARVSADAVRTDPRLRGPNLWDARFTTADGSLLCLRIGWMLPQLPPSTLRLVGPHGAIDCDLSAGTARIHIGGVTRTETLGRPTQEWAAQLDTFAGAIARGRAETATVEDGLRALMATTCSERSAQEGQPVTLMAQSRSSAAG